MERPGPARDALVDGDRGPLGLRLPRVLSVLVVLLTLLLTLSSWYLLQVAQEQRDQVLFAERAREIASHLQMRLMDDEQVLRGGVGLFAVHQQVSRDDWRRYVSTLRIGETFPGIQGVGFARWIPPGEREAAIRAVRAEGFPEFTIHPPGERQAYTAIVYLEPFDWRNQRAFGYDMFSEPVRRAAMEAARDSGNVRLSGRITLVQETERDPQAGFLMYLPVYRRGEPADTVERRRASLVGFVYSPIRARDFVVAALERLPGDIAFEVHAGAGPDPAALLFSSLGAQGRALPAGYRPALEATRLVVSNGGTWHLGFRSLPEFGAGPQRRLPGVVLASGLLVTLLLGGIAWVLASSRQRALAAARQLRESEARFRSFFDQPLLGAALTSPQKGWLAANDRLCQMLGYGFEELRHLSWADLTHPADLARDLEQFELVLSGAQDGYRAEKRFLRKDGQPIWTELAVQAERDRDGKVTYLAALLQDVSARKMEERITAARLDLMDFALSHPLPALLSRTLDRVEELTGSQIGFYHFVDPDERTLHLQAWSTGTAAVFCKAEGAGSHYDIDLAGVWVDCIHQRRPVIHNDYASLAHRKGLPPGHAPVIRELVVPVFRSGRIVAVLGTGNKPTDYTEADVAVVSRFADLAWDIAERKMVLDRLREADARFAAAFEHAPVILTLARYEDGVLLDVNERFVEVSGFSRAEAIGRSVIELGWLSAEERGRLLRDLEEKGRTAAMELRVRTKAGKPLVAEYWARPLTVGGQRSLLSLVVDVTEQRALQKQLAQAQRLESVGRLAGGVAHDFNNMLAVILGHVDLLLREQPADDPLRPDLEEVRDAARRATVVTRQLLAFARQQPVTPQLLDLNQTLAGMLKMLRRLIGEDVDLVWSPGASLPPVRIDPSQVDQLLANLCVNARDAIAGAGRVTIQTAEAQLDEPFRARHPGLAPGRWVRITVADSGAGIDPEVLPHVFEPFFTTKGEGRGTGLGLATVYGIVRQNGGAVEVKSLPGEGATFHIYLRGADEAEVPVAAEGAAAAVARGQETVLLVEDEASVLKLCTFMLRHLGYKVLPCTGSLEALRVAEAYGGDIELLLSDVVLPEMGGSELLAELLRKRPRLRWLFMSGYAPEHVARHGVAAAEGPFLEKPFEAETLAAKVRQALATPPGPPPGPAPASARATS